MTPARQAALNAHRRRLHAAFYERPVFCTHCRQWVRRETTEMVPIGNGRGRVQCIAHGEKKARDEE